MNNPLEIAKYLVSALGVFVFIISGCGDSRFTRVKPVAVINTSSTSPVISNIILNGIGSYDPNDEALTYKWALADVPPGSSATLVSSITAVTSFLADKSGYFTVTLQVTNSSGSASDFTSAVIQITGDGTINPVAVIKANTSVQVNTSVVLDGSSSNDPLDESLTYLWSLVEKPSGSVAALVSLTDALTSFFADKGGYYTVTLTVTNKSGKVSESSSARIDAGGTGGNHPPVAIIKKTESGVMALLDGSGSYDIDGDPISYRWTVPTVGAPPLQQGVTSPVFTLRTSETTAGTYNFIVRLDVSDGIDTDSAFVSVVITVP